jgi:chromosome segregation ATPase
VKITKLRAENYKRLKVVDVEFPQRGVLNVTGRNGQGKSSLLDSIWAAFGSLKAVPEVPIRAGEDHAEIQVSTDEYTITRKFAINQRTGEPTSTLTVESHNGARFPSPQHLLDKFWRPIAFDPLAFERLDERQQYDQLRGLVKLDLDLEALEGLNRRDYETRRDINREAERLRAQATGIQIPNEESLPAARLDLEELNKELQAAAAHNTEIEQRRFTQQRAKERLAAYDNDIAELERQIAELQERLEAGRFKRAELAADPLLTEELPTPINTLQLVTRAQQAGQINHLIDERERRKTLEAEAEALEQRSDALTAAMEERERQKRQALEAAEMPIKGLGLADGRVTLQGLPLKQASQADQLRVSTAIAMALNPGLRLILVREGAVADDDTLAMMAELAEAGDYQLVIESIDPTGKIGVVLEDGEIAEVITPEQAAADKAAAPRRRVRRTVSEPGSLI